VRQRAKSGMLGEPVVPGVHQSEFLNRWLQTERQAGSRLAACGMRRIGACREDLREIAFTGVLVRSVLEWHALRIPRSTLQIEVAEYPGSGLPGLEKSQALDSELGQLRRRGASHH